MPRRFDEAETTEEFPGDFSFEHRPRRPSPLVVWNGSLVESFIPPGGLLLGKLSGSAFLAFASLTQPTQQ